jgi:C4-dicarboxylate-specific signal transduction histidine kinase
MIISFKLATNIKKSFVLYKSIVKKKEKQLEDINNNLEHKIKKEIEKSRKKDTQLLQQARFASLGEMIGNIAHQWRQPLSAISTISSSNIVSTELGILSEAESIDSNNKILKHVEFLSQTIDDFRNYLVASKDEKKIAFDIKDTINDIKNIIDVVYKDNNISLNINFSNESMKCFGISSQLSQVILNILNNAKDVLIQNDIKIKSVFIDTKVSGKFNTISIYDNGGGVPDEILEKIFDPYFTTKHQSQGTGIGLYMSKDIIQTKYDGALDVQNIQWKYENTEYFGACFTLQIPVYNS